MRTKNIGNITGSKMYKRPLNLTVDNKNVGFTDYKKIYKLQTTKGDLIFERILNSATAMNQKGFSASQILYKAVLTSKALGNILC